MIRIFLLSSLLSPLLFGGIAKKPDQERAKELKEYLSRERPNFEARESQRRDIIDDLDKLNADQNRVRERMSKIVANQQELNMALENMTMEVQKQRHLELVQRKRIMLLLKVAYKIRKDGMLRFVVRGDNLSDLAGRVRILYRTLRSHSVMTRQLADRAARLAEAEAQLAQTRETMQSLLEELSEQEMLLGSFLDKKKRVMGEISQRQSVYQSAIKEYKQVSSQLASLFDNFESSRDTSIGTFLPNRGTLPLPVGLGTVVKTFGKSVHSKFHTVTYQKGIEIESDHNTPVLAVMPGLIEYEGWIKGLGNVVIIHHGGGFYTLSAHLFKSMATRGAQVQQGDTIGLVGDTGDNERPSLYFEVRENSKAVDPLAYFSPKALASLK